MIKYVQLQRWNKKKSSWKNKEWKKNVESDLIVIEDDSLKKKQKKNQIEEDEDDDLTLDYLKKTSV